MESRQDARLCHRIYRRVIFVTCVLVFGFFSSAAMADIVIDHLPYQIENVSNQNYVLSGSLSSATDGIRIGNNVHNVTLDLGNDTIRFGYGGGDNNYGIGIYWNPYDITIRGGYIIHDKGAVSDSATNNRCIFIGKSHDVLIENVNCVVDGIDGRCFSNNTGGYNIEISGGTWRSNSVNFTSRCDNTGSVIRYHAEQELQHPDDYHIKIHDLTITDGPHTGIAINNPPYDLLNKVFIYNNHITTDSRDSLYSTYISTCKTPADAYGISLYGIAPGSEIHDNIIRTGTRFEGNLGMLVQQSRGTLAQPVRIFNNDVHTWQGPNLEWPYGKCNSLYWRNVPGEANTSSMYTYIYNNIFKCTVDNDLATTYRGSNAEVISIFWEDSTCNNIFEKNLVECVAADGDLNGLRDANCLGWCVRDTLWVDSSYNSCEMVKNNVFRYNHYKSFRNPVALAGNRGYPGSNLLLYRDTIQCTDLSRTDSTTLIFDRSTGYRMHATGHRLRDCIFLGSSSDNDVEFSFQSYSDIDSMGQDVRFERTLNVWVKGYNGQPVVNASVWVTNNYGRTIFSGQTNEGGYIGGVVSYKYMANDPVDGDDIVLQDSLNYNDFVVKAIRYGDVSAHYFTVNANNAHDTITLNSTFGSGQWGSGGPVDCQDAPLAPAQIYPTDLTETSPRPTLCILNAAVGGCENDIAYDFQIASDTDMNNLVEEASGIAQDAGSTCYASTADLTIGQTYYWRARTYNGNLYSGWSAVESFVPGQNSCGDANGDLSVNVADGVYLINHVFLNGPEPTVYENGDANCDGILNVSDAVFIINHVFTGGPQPCDTDLDGSPDC